MADFEDKLDNVAKLKGGPKHKWLIEHKDLVIQFQQEFGPEATRETFHLKETTLHNLIGISAYNHIPRLTKADRALAQVEILGANIQDLRQEIRTLRQIFERFQFSVGQQLVEKFFMPLLQSGIKISDDLNLDKEDVLSLKDLDLIETPQLTRGRKKRR